MQNASFFVYSDADRFFGDRLNLQHCIFKESTKYLIHSSIVSRLDTNPRITDIGTGTGIWLPDLVGSESFSSTA